MPTWRKTLAATIVSCAMTGSYALPALAMGKWSPSWVSENQGGKGGKGGSGGPPGRSVGAPGPIAGAGLPILLIAGGYVLVRRYRNPSKAE